LLASGYFFLIALAVRDGDAAGAERQMEALRRIEPYVGVRDRARVFLPLARGDVARLRGDLTTAREAYAEATRLALRFPEPGSTPFLLGSWAVYFLASGDARQAAIIQGAIESNLGRAQIDARNLRDIYLDPTVVAGSRESLGEEAYLAAFAEGQRLTLEQMLERTLASATADSPSAP